MDQRAKDFDKDNDDVEDLLPLEYKDLAKVFSVKESNKLAPRRGLSNHHIQLEGKIDWDPKLYRHTAQEMDEIRKWVKENLLKGFITASSALWASPILFVKKPNGGIRLCIDYRKLNAISKKDKYPLPLIDDIISMLLKGCEYITRLDVRSAFNRIRMALDEDENLTTFATPIGNYKSKVLPFGLTGGPATFQRYINSTLIEYLNDFCAAYMDDILIISKTKEEHIQQVRKVLKKLNEAGLQVDIRKLEFSVNKTKFLGLIVLKDGIEMDPEKTADIKDWELPQTVRDIQSFIGFCNFYRRFIAMFSRIAQPLISLTRKEFKGKLVKLTPKAIKAFDKLKIAVTTAPVLAHFNPNKKSYVEVDSSDTVQGGCLSQYGLDKLLHPIAFFSRKLVSAECNYEIYDKELLAIVRAFEHWRPELEGIELPIQVLTDYRALQYFITTKSLTPRQARWALTLSKYNFEIQYRPGKQNTLANTLSRRSQDIQTFNRDQILLPESKLSPKLKEVQKQLYLTSKTNTASKTAILAPILFDNLEPQTLLATQVKAAQATDPDSQRLLKALKDKARKDPAKEVELALCTERENCLYYRGRLWVPDSLRTKVIENIHCSELTGHPGIAKTLFFLSKSYYWPRVNASITQYIRNCYDCKRNKSPRDTYNGVLQPLQIANQPWRYISMDHIVALP